MKNIIFTVAFMLLMYDIAYSQNYLNDGGFEQGNSSIDMSGGTCGSVVGRVTDCSRTSEDAKQINNNCPGGYGGLQYKSMYWTGRGSFSNNCTEDCEPHLPDWLWYNPAHDPNNGYADGVLELDYFIGEETKPQGIKPYEGFGAAGGQPYEMFQSQLNRPMNISGYYYVSGFIKKIDSYLGTTLPDYKVNWILSNQQPNYKDGSCSAYDDNGNLNYERIDNIDLGSGYGPDLQMDIPISFSNTDFEDWQYVEKEVFVSGRADLEWFSVNVGLATEQSRENETYAPYFGFDNMYVSDRECSCPIIRLLQDQIIQPSSLIRAQQYIRAGYNVGNAGSPLGNTQVLAGTSGETIFRAGNYISLEPGFVVNAGAVFETQIRDCYDAPIPITVVLPDAYSPNCDGVNDLYCFFPQNATSYSVDVFDEGGQEVDYQTGQIAPGQTEVCLDISLDEPGTNIYLFYIDLYGCNNDPKHTEQNVEVIDATEGCYAASKNFAPKEDTTSNEMGVSSTQSKISKQIEIYPNPSCDLVNIKVSSYLISDRIVISCIDGKVVKEYTCTGLNASYNVSDIDDGVYTITYISDDSCTIKKFTKICQ